MHSFISLGIFELLSLILNVRLIILKSANKNVVFRQSSEYEIKVYLMIHKIFIAIQEYLNI